jgi:membrane-associated phospholipid phosphatase
MNDRRQEQLLLLFATLLFCIISFFLFDKPLTLWLHQFEHGPWHDFWDTITQAGKSEWYLVGGIVLFAGFRKWNRQLSLNGLFLFSTVAVSGLSADLVKFIVGRARPELFLEQGIYGFEPLHGHFDYSWISFPSGHSATALSAALSLSLIVPRLRPALISGGVLIAASRVVLCHHYLSDVVAGSALGIETVVLLYPMVFRNSPDEKPVHAPSRLSTIFQRQSR